MSDADLRALRRELADAVAIVRAYGQAIIDSKPTLYGMDQLRQHWPAWGDDRIKAELAARGCTFGRGHRVEVHISIVEAIDRHLAAEAQALLERRSA